MAAIRLAMGATFLAAPVFAVRLLGTDTATAKRVTYLARMAAARDVALAGGALLAGSDAAAAKWVMASALCDAADATVIAGAIRSGTAGGPVAVGTVAGAAGAAVVGGWAAFRLRRA